MNITMIGTGYVGLVTGACLADMGNEVLCVDVDLRKIDRLLSGEIPIHEPGLDKVVHRNVAAGRLRFSSDPKAGALFGEIQMIAVGTPPDEDGSADLSYVLEAARSIAQHMDGYRCVVDKSTVPVGTGDKVQTVMTETLASRGLELPFSVASNPEFLKEGAAVEDFMKPDRIVLGVEDERAERILRELYAPFQRNHERTFVMRRRAAELTKYAANAMLATRISFMNELSRLAEKVGVDIEQVRIGIGSDSRIGYSFLYAGAGYGGSCFPKDVSAFIRIAEEMGVDFGLMREVEKINAAIPERFLKKIRASLWTMRDKKIGQLGLAFKGNTDDVRCSVAVELIRRMAAEGAIIRCHDPKGGEKAKELLPKNVEIMADAHQVAEGADVLIIATEWPEYRLLDWSKIKTLMRTPRIFDGRNLLNPAEMISLGFEYTSIGR
ncbi:MAG: UDP-glucose/GDP-mannose dehydrogenase family protein [Betaproteobacteria bacterium]|nr:UDP-glucose/GDP-mannose dehydrogenase family protein [Betaproteobacteria bacterium]